MKNDIRSLDLNLLKALDALLDEKSVTKASQRLHITQPAVSGMLTRLRDYFDDPLFIRTSHGMVPTIRASELALPIKTVLNDISSLLNTTDFNPLTADMIYTISATDYALKAVIIPLMAALKQRAPLIRIAVKIVNDEQIYQQLALGEIDLALVTPQSTPPDLHGRSLYEEVYVWVARNNHPLADHKKITLHEFCQQEHILVSSQGKFTAVTDKVLSELQQVRRVGMSVNSFLVIPEILKLTDMVAVIPRRMVPEDGSLKILSLPINIPGFTKSMAWHERTHRDKAHQWIRSLCVEISQHTD